MIKLSVCCHQPHHWQKASKTRKKESDTRCRKVLEHFWISITKHFLFLAPLLHCWVTLAKKKLSKTLLLYWYPIEIYCVLCCLTGTLLLTIYFSLKVSHSLECQYTVKFNKGVYCYRLSCWGESAGYNIVDRTLRIKMRKSDKLSNFINKLIPGKNCFNLIGSLSLAPAWEPSC